MNLAVRIDTQPSGEIQAYVSVIDLKATEVNHSSAEQMISFDEKYDIRVNEFLPADKNHLFNDPRYFAIHAGSHNDLYMQLVRKSDSRVFLTVAIYETDPGFFKSPKLGTFGGISQNGYVNFARLERFLCLVVDHLKSLGARALSIAIAPASHDLAFFSSMFNLMRRQGFVEVAHEINFDLLIDERPFLDRIDYGNVKRIRKCIRSDFACSKVEHERLGEVYDVIAESRSRLGLKVSMTVRQLQEMLNLFPEKFHLFAVYRDASRLEMVAAAVCISLTDKNMYVFYWGDLPEVATHSPIAMLAEKIYEFCQQEKFLLLDAGISTVDGQPNYGLIRFKQNLGFSESLKVSFKLDFV